MSMGRAGGRGRFDPMEFMPALPDGSTPSPQPIQPYAPPPPPPFGGDLPNGWETDTKTVSTGDITVGPFGGPFVEYTLFATKAPHNGIDVTISNLPLQSSIGAYGLRLYAVNGRVRALVDVWSSQGSDGSVRALAGRGGAQRWEVAMISSGVQAGLGLVTPFNVSYVAGDLPTAPNELGVRRAKNNTVAGNGAVFDVSAGVQFGNGLNPLVLSAIELSNTTNAQLWAHVDDAIAGAASVAATLQLSLGVPANSSRFIRFPNGAGVVQGVENAVRSDSTFAKGIRIFGSTGVPAPSVAPGAGALFATVWLK